MCDYSLCGVPNRLAVEGEELVFHRFPTGSMGLASPVDLATVHASPSAEPKGVWQRIKNFIEGEVTLRSVTAVCIPPGAQLVLKSMPEDLQQKWQIGAEESAFFIQTSANANSYRDAVCFYDGTQVSLQSFREGIRAEVLSLGGAAPDEDRLRTVQAF